MIRRSAALLGFVVPAGIFTSCLHAQDIVSTIGITTLPLVHAQQSSAMRGLRASFTPTERWSYYVHRTYQPQRLGILAVETLMDHALGQPTCWDRSPASYLTRYSRSFDRRMIRNTAEFGAGLLTGEDLRYQR